MPLPVSSLYPPASRDPFKFASRRSVVHSLNGIVSCTQPLAAKCGIDMLNAGGNAADAAVAVAAGMNMTEPCSTGIGGDMFCLFFDARTKRVSALNGSGRSGARFTLERIEESLGAGAQTKTKTGGRAGGGGEGGKKMPSKIPAHCPHAVTVPGAAAGWVDTVERFGSGKLGMREILAPAIALGEKGFVVSELAAYYWNRSERILRQASPNFAEMLKKDPGAPDGVRAPLAGEIMRNPTLAQTFRTLAEEGKKGFYTGRVAEAIVKVCTDLGGHLELGDLEHHLQVGSEPVEPISLTFGGQGLEEDGKKAGVALWEHPPNGQGIVALMALGILRELELQGKIPTWASDDFNTAPYLHAIIESLRIAFADGNWWIADPNVSKLPVAELVSEPYLRERAKLFSADKASPLLRRGDPAEVSPALRSSDTVYFAVSDRDGNACSFINSNFMGFGTGIIPAGCGFTLQNRGTGFVIGGAARAGGGHHPNALGPRKRPYHTIIPGLATNLRDGSLHSVFGVMGGYMQPQGHVQVLLGQLVGGLNPQQALDAPRVCVGPGFPGQEDDAYDMTVSVEEGMGEEAVEGLRRLGHKVAVVTGMGRAMFGRGQIIRWTVDEVEGIGVWSAGSDMRGDGAAFPA